MSYIHKRTGSSEEGALETSAAILMPLVFAVMFLVVQFGLWMYANVAVDQAAQHAAQTIAVNGDNPEWDAQQGATSAVAAVLADTTGVQNVAVSAGHDGDTGFVVVSGKSVEIIPFVLDWSVESRKQVSIERFIPFGER